MPDLNKAIEDVKSIVETAKDISDNGNAIAQNIQNPTTSDISSPSMSIEAPMVAKSTTLILMFIALGFTILLILIGVYCKTAYDKDISIIIAQALGYTAPITLGCLAKRGVEHVATVKYTNK